MKIRHTCNTGISFAPKIQNNSSRRFKVAIFSQNISYHEDAECACAAGCKGLITWKRNACKQRFLKADRKDSYISKSRQWYGAWCSSNILLYICNNELLELTVRKQKQGITWEKLVYKCRKLFHIARELHHWIKPNSDNSMLYQNSNYIYKIQVFINYFIWGSVCY